MKRIQGSNQLGHVVGFVQVEQEFFDLPSSPIPAPRPSSAFPPHIRIGVDGSYALAVRFLLGWCEVGKGAGNGEDKVHFLKPSAGIRLVYVDETGRPILLA